MAVKAKLRNFFSKYIVLIEIIIAPIILSALPLAIRSKEASCGYVLLLLSFYWITECIPIALTSILPVLLLPLFGIMETKVVTPIYFRDTVMFIFTSTVIGIGIEVTGLHEKIALKVCMLVGSDAKWVLLGIMSINSFLSLWISNTTCVAMSLPIVLSLVKELVKLDPIYFDEPENSSSIDISSSEIEMKEANSYNVTKEDDTEALNSKKSYFKTKNALNLIKCFYLAVAYASTIGGTGSLIGTAPNIVLKGYFEDNYPKDSMNFVTFLAFSAPISVILTIICWVILCLMWFPKGKFFSLKKSKVGVKIGNDTNTIKIIIKQKYDSLGPYSWEQLSVGFWFAIAIILWVTRDLFYVDGWQALFKDGYVSDTTAAVLIVVCLSCWPKYNIFKGHNYVPLLTWKQINDLHGWNVLFLVGGSLALAEAVEKSGLSKWVGEILQNILPNNRELTLIVLMIFSVIGTEFTSNVSMISILLPILSNLAIAVNFSFMFPASTAPNAMVYGQGILAIKDMAITGIVLKLVSMVVLFGASNSLLLGIFDTTEIIADNILNTTTIRSL